MTKKILLSSLVATLALANTTPLEKAMEYYKNKAYPKALVEFEKISPLLVDAQKADFYIGRSHYELGNYEQALIAYDRFLINNPNHKRAQLEIAQTYFMLKMYDEALQGFQSLMTDPQIPEVVKQNIQIRIGAIKSKMTKHNYQLTALFGLGYDTNINNTTNQSSYDIYIPTFNANLTIPTEDKKDSFFYDMGMVFNHLYTHSDTMALRNGITLYHQNYERVNNKETSLISLSSAPIWKIKNANVMVNFGFDYIWYNSDSYLDVLHITPSISQGIDENKLYYGALKISQKNFVVEHQDKDSMVYELTNRLMFQTKEYGVFGVDLILGKEQRERSVRTDVSKDYYTLKGTNSYQINDKTTLGGSLAYTQTKYKYEDVNFLSKRDDKNYNLGFNLGYKYDPKTTVGVSYNYINQDSNQAPFDYDKNVIKTYLYYTF